MSHVVLRVLPRVARHRRPDLAPHVVLHVLQRDVHCVLAVRGALGALGVQSVASHPGPGSSEAHPAGRMIGIGLRAREP